MFRGPWPDVEIPETPLHELVLERAAALGEKPAFIEGPTGRVLTYAALAEAVRRTAAGFAALGLRKGEVVGLYAPNVPEYPVVFYGAVSAGGVVTTANPLYTAPELARQLSDAGARFLVTVPALLDQAREAAAEAGVEAVFTMDDPALRGDGDPPTVEIDPDDLVALPYSSGTTGLPKGAMLTHRSLVANLCQVDAAGSGSERDIVVAFLPFFHIYGLLLLMSLGIRLGLTTVTMPRFDLEQYLDLLEQHRSTRAYIVPPVALALAKHPAVEGRDLSSLELAFCGAAPMSDELEEAFLARIGCPLVQGFGMTELSGVSHRTPEEASRRRKGSVGPPIPNTECRIVDLENGNDVAAGDIGEVLIRGPQVMRGYLGNPEATAATIDGDGWLRTGDIGRCDTDGYLYVVDRLKELIKYKAFQVAPAELEALLLTHPAVADAAVIPSPDDEAGEVPKAFVVLRAQAAEDELMAFVAERVAPHKRIRKLEVVEEIPKSASGKILRRVLVERERSSATRA